MPIRYTGHRINVGPRLNRAVRTMQARYRYKKNVRLLKIRREMSAVGRAMSNYKRTGYYQTRYGKRMKVAAPKQYCQAVQSFVKTSLDTVRVSLGNFAWQFFITPASNTDDRSLTARHGNKVSVRGLRICRQFEFLPPGEALGVCPPIMVHYAILQAKKPDFANQGESTQTLQLKLDFFRVFEYQNKRSADFVSNGPLSLWSNLMNTAPINPDSDFNVITHMRRVMEQPPALVDTPTGSLNIRQRNYVWNIRKYMKINKTLNVANVYDSQLDNPLIEVIWYQTVTPEGYPNPADQLWLQTWQQNTCYFHSSENP